MAWIIRNTTGSPILIDDLGIIVDPNVLYDLEQFDYDLYELTDSDDLYALIANGDIILNDGVKDLAVEEALLHIGINSKLEDEKAVNALPPGGKKDAKLVKLSDDDFDVGWDDEKEDDIHISVHDEFNEKHWERGTVFTFAGTNSLSSTPIAVSFFTEWDCKKGNDGKLRIRDLDNKKTICTVSGFPGEQDDYVYKIANTLENLPATQARFQVQGRVSHEKDEIKVKEVVISF